ncbi:tRNA pseudouridine synthase 8 [Hyphodiscus hymeniophilus]|uniref:tRNA pseudouridine synthase 8 n=1 Tax=Hyphodiscus hymeniophilus TaxID=353542 RepID=A0A9P6VJM7_9HELO|nr:tRNA pseudouridine synthase 8 [Hyphodiscus hymeniophilus]
MEAILQLPTATNDHQAYMAYALNLARCSPPKPTNYRVGAVLVNASTNTIVSTGYTLECEGNTHAEQSCFIKLLDEHGIPEDQLSSILPDNTVLYTTVEPCFKRLSGNLPCVQRILALGRDGKGIKTVYVGIREPEKTQLEEAGIKVVHVEGLEQQILEVATAGHVSSEKQDA